MDDYGPKVIHIGCSASEPGVWIRLPYHQLRCSACGVTVTEQKPKKSQGARRKERAAAGRPLITLSIQQSTLDKLVRLSRMLGMSRSDTIAFLIDNRPDVLYSPEAAEPRRESEECAKHGRVGCLECGMKEFGDR